MIIETKIVYVCDICECQKSEENIKGVEFIGSSHSFTLGDAEDAREFRSNVTNETMQKHICYECIACIDKFIMRHQ